MRVALPAIAIPAVVVVLYVVVPGVRTAPWTASRIAGAVLAVSGYILVCLARIQLGNSFTVQPNATKLVTHGLYSRIRNPIYVFVDRIPVGIFLLLNLPWLLIVVPVLTVTQTIQARREARVLERAFGKAYVEYRKQTWF